MDATNKSCDYTVTAGASAASEVTSFTVPYISAGGHTQNATISVSIEPPSELLFPNPVSFDLGRNNTLTFNALDYVEEHSFHTVSCADATGVDNTKLVSVSRDTSGTGCNFTVDPINTLVVTRPVTTTFYVTFRSTGGRIANGSFTISIGPDANFSFTPPATFMTGRNRFLRFNVLDYVSESPDHTVTCSDASGVVSTKVRVLRSSSGDGCGFTVIPVSTLATTLQGETSFSVVISSTGGDVVTGTFTFYIGGDSTITYTAPTDLATGRNKALTIDATNYVTEADPTWRIICGDAIRIHSRLASVSRVANSCRFTITPRADVGSGSASFTIPYSSTGGHTINAKVSLEVGKDSFIDFTSPTLPVLAVNRTLDIRALELSLIHI